MSGAIARSRAAALAVMLAASLAADPAAIGTQVPDAPRVLVATFDLIDAEPRAYWLGEASALLVGDALRASGAAVIGRSERVRALEALNLPAAASLSHATMMHVGRILGASELIVGSVGLRNDALTVRARRIDLTTGERGEDLLEAGALRSLFDLYARLGRRLAPAGARPAVVAADPSLEVFELYVKGLLAESSVVRMRHLEQALLLQPGYAPARLALWELHHDMGSHARALAEARAIVAEGPHLRRARFYGAISLLEMDQHHEAFVAFRALADEAPAAAIYNNLGVLQVRRGWTPQTGRPSFYLQKAVDLAPDDPDFCFNLGYALWLEREPSAAAYWLREAVGRDPADGDAHLVLAAALDATGFPADAARERQLARQIWPRNAERAWPAGEVPEGLERVRYDLEPALALAPAAPVAESPSGR